MRNLFRLCLLVSCLTLTACAQDRDAFAEFKADAVDWTPISRAIAASNTFYFCKAHPKPDRYDVLCEACHVTLHADVKDGSVGSLVAYASHMHHDLKPRGDIERPRISRSGDVAVETLRSEVGSKTEAKRLFGEANDWCKGRRDGEFKILKNDIELTFEGFSQ